MEYNGGVFLVRKGLDPTRSLTIAGAVLLAASAGPAHGSARLAIPKEEAVHLVVTHRALRPLEGTVVRLRPVPPADVEVRWRGGSRIPSTRGQTWYQAPYVVTPERAFARVVAILARGRDEVEVETTIALEPGAVPGAEDCLGPGQSYSPDGPDILPQHTPLDEFPRLIRRVEPRVSPGHAPRDGDVTIILHVLLCRTGRVLDAWAPAIHGQPDGIPQEQDPQFVAAAIEAALQYEFEPARAAGEPIAVWMALPLRFTR